MKHIKSIWGGFIKGFTGTLGALAGLVLILLVSSEYFEASIYLKAYDVTILDAQVRKP